MHHIEAQTYVGKVPTYGRGAQTFVGAGSGDSMSAAGSDPRLVTFGDAVRSLRLEARLSQDAVERRGELTRNHVGQIERAARDPQLSTLLRLADGLDVPLSEIVAAYEARLARGD